MKDIYPKVYLYKRIVQAKLFIDRHYSEAIDLDNIAGTAYFSKFHFIRLFKTIYGHTPHRYLVKVRLEEAKLLLEKEHPVSEACYDTGFESLTSFSALFKRYTGFTPAVYRKDRIKRTALMKEVPLQFIPNCFAQDHIADKNAISDKPSKA
jgi:AraC-like DNA-binding protein